MSVPKLNSSRATLNCKKDMKDACFTSALKEEDLVVDG